jgi:hypothetical protein
MGEKRGAGRDLLGDISRRDHLENLGLDERSIFKRMVRTRMRGTGFIGPRNVKSDGLL